MTHPSTWEQQCREQAKRIAELEAALAKLIVAALESVEIGGEDGKLHAIHGAIMARDTLKSPQEPPEAAPQRDNER